MRMTTWMAGALACVALPGMSAAAVVVSLNNPGSTTVHEAVVEPGDSFSVDVNIDPTPAMVWVRFELTASASGILALSDGIFYSPFDMAISQIPPGPLLPHSAELGAAVSTFDPQQVLSPLGSLSLTVDPGVQPGMYTVNLTNIHWQNSWITTILPYVAQAGPDFNIQVVPEPSALAGALLMLGVLPRRWTVCF